MKKKIVYNGMCCTVKLKAALMLEGLKNPETAQMVLEQIVKAELKRGPQNLQKVTDGMAVSVNELDDERLARLFDELYIGQPSLKGLSPDNELYMRFIIEWDGREFGTESLYYLALAIVKKERCREALLQADGEEPGVFARAYRDSRFRDTPFLHMFIQEERHWAALALGLLLLVRQEPEEGRHYRKLMEILYSGYKSLKNTVKKLDVLESEQMYTGMDKEDEDFLETLAAMMVQYVIAEDLNIPVREDFLFYVRLQIFGRYNRLMLGEYSTSEPDMEMARKYYRKFAKEYPVPGSFYHCYYLDKRQSQKKTKPEQPNGIEDWKTGPPEYTAEELVEAMNAKPTGLEMLFSQYGLNLRMLSGVRLERKEVEGIFEAMGKLATEKYIRVLLIATLCKYIAALQKGYDENRQEALLAQEEALQKQKEELKREQDSFIREKDSFENQRKNLEERLKEQELQTERYLRRLENVREKLEMQTEELSALRSFVFLLGEAEESREESEDEKKEALLRQECMRKFRKSIVVGGHPGWQRKMKQVLPDAAFVAADNKQFDFAALGGRESIIINTDILKHSCYCKIMAGKKKGQKVLYVHGNNIDRCVAELAGQM